MAKAQILVVEDDNIVVMELRDRLQSLGYAVCAVASYGEEAIEKAAETRPDLVLMDIRLKGAMDGIEAAEQIRARFHIPVVYLTAYADESTLQRAKVTEPYGYILKPFEDRELHTAIEITLYKHSMEKKLKESERWLATTLRSIGDAVIATDEKGLVTFMNPVAEALTGWKQEDALGKDLTEVLHIVSEETHRVAENLAAKVTQKGTVVSLTNHILMARDGTETPIDDSAAPIRNDEGNVTGVVLVFRDITERKWAEEALRQSEARNRTILNAIPDLMFQISKDGTFLRYKEARVDELALPPSEFLGKKVYEVMPTEFAQQVMHCVERALQTGEIQIFEYQLPVPLPNGDMRDYEARLVVSGEDEVLTIVRDITGRKRAEEALKASQEYTKSIIDSSLDMIIAVDMGRYIVEFNKSAQETFGYRPEEVLGVQADILYIDPQEALIVHETTVKKGQCIREVFNRRKNGEIFPSFLSASVLRDVGGEVVGVMGVSRDISDRKRVEEALGRRSRELALLNRAGRAFSSTLDLDQVLVTVLEEVRRLLGVVACSAWLTDPETDELVCRQAVGPQSDIVRGWRLAPGEGLAGWVACSGESLIMPDTRSDERHFKGVDRQTGLALRSILSVPLRVKQDVIGVLQTADTEVDRFGPIDLGLVESLGASAAIAIENARLYEAEAQRRQEAETLRQAAAALTSTLDLEQILDCILEQVSRVVPNDAVSIMLIEGDQAHFVRWRGYERFGGEEFASTVVFRIPEVPNLQQILESGEPMVVPDTATYPGWVHVPVGGWSRSYAAAPIIVRGEVIGFLNVNSAIPGFFTQAHVGPLRGFADHAAAAIENARLYEQAQRDAETQSVLLREVNHRVQNNLTAIIGLLYAARRRTGMEDQAVYQSIMQDLVNQVQGLSTVHSLFSASRWVPLPLSELATQVVESSLRMLPCDKRVSVEMSPSPVRVTPDQAHSLALVINEFATNTVKHALWERNTAHITVRIGLDDDTVLFEFRDDGPGYPEEVLQLERHTVGLDLIQNIVRRGLHGELSLHNDHGAVAVIQFEAKA